MNSTQEQKKPARAKKLPAGVISFEQAKNSSAMLEKKKRHLEERIAEAQAHIKQQDWILEGWRVQLRHDIAKLEAMREQRH